jgi:hypothetical protein
MEKTARPGYKFDHINRRIIITREFNKNANVFGSNEYKTLQKLRKALPDYTVTFTAPHRKTSAKSHMTLERMIRYIEKQPDSETIMADLNKVRFPENCAIPAPFSVVKQWFFKRFPNYGQMTPFDDNGQIIENDVVAAS